jgi:hypothetical protein
MKYPMMVALTIALSTTFLSVSNMAFADAGPTGVIRISKGTIKNYIFDHSLPDSCSEKYWVTAYKSYKIVTTSGVIETGVWARGEGNSPCDCAKEESIKELDSDIEKFNIINQGDIRKNCNEKNGCTCSVIVADLLVLDGVVQKQENLSVIVKCP